MHYRTQLRRDTSMHTEELPIENTAQRQYIKKVHDALIDFLVVLMKTYILDIFYIPPES